MEFKCLTCEGEPIHEMVSNERIEYICLGCNITVGVVENE